MRVIAKGTVFLLGNIKVIASSDIALSGEGMEIFILNLWEQCDYKDVNVLPVECVECKNMEEIYQVKKGNIVLGRWDNICMK